MDGLTMMDDPHDDDAVPAGMEKGGAMDQVAEQMEHTIMKSMDDAISMLSNYLVTSGASRDPSRAAAMGMDMLRDAGFREPSADALERMISGDDEDDMGMMQEGIENINAENMQIVADALQKMAPLLGVMSLPVLIGLIYEQLKSMGAK